MSRQCPSRRELADERAPPLCSSWRWPCRSCIASNASGDGDRRQARPRPDASPFGSTPCVSRCEILAEDYDNAQIRLARVRGQVSAARQAVDRTNREIAKRQRDLARYAISAYTSGDDGGLGLMLSADGSRSAPARGTRRRPSATRPIWSIRCEPPSPTANHGSRISNGPRSRLTTPRRWSTRSARRRRPRSPRRSRSTSASKAS